MVQEQALTVAETDWLEFQQMLDESNLREFGTTDEEKIIRIGADRHRQDILASLCGMDEEQADWEEGEDDDDDSIRVSYDR